MADLELRGLRKSFDGRHEVVGGISLYVAHGEVLTVLGPSGCGKSTLLRLIAGLETPEEGQVVIGGRVVNDLEPKDRDIAMVFQSYALYPHMRVAENIAVSLRLRGMPREEIRNRVEAVARRLGIEDHLDRHPRELSGGERQRVALARALVREPKVFLFDEPLSNLDAQLRERARTELKEIFRQLRVTVVYVTHDQLEALTLSHRVAVMKEGRIEQVAGPADLYARPASLFVAGFVGSPRMNLVAGDLLAESAETVGYRPEDVEVRSDGERGMDVVLDEPLGAQRLLTLRQGELELRAWVPPDFPPTAHVRVHLDTSRAHRFDAAGHRLGDAEGGPPR